jgi:putative salt-induced outer membrane protein YdiY
MKFFFFLALFTLQLLAQDKIVVEDRSGLSDDEVRQIAKKSDKLLNQNVSKFKKQWEDLSPTPVGYDWVETKKGEWFKGEIKGLFDDKLEFDSEEIGLYDFDIDDISQIKSYHLVSLNIEDKAIFTGILRLKNNIYTIIQGKHTYEFPERSVVSFAKAGEHERNLWSAKVAISLDIRQGNIDQQDFSASINLQRRTAKSRLQLDYLGRSSIKNDERISNDHRLNEKYDIYISRQFFWTPLFSELYSDKYKNITLQLTLGLGLGYTIMNKSDIEWSVSAGPAVLYTNYNTVAQAKDKISKSPSMEFSTNLEKELSKKIDLTYNYKFSFVNNESGRYKHHMVIKLENELMTWLDFDVTGVWDYVHNPIKESDGHTPVKSDIQLLFGFGIEF